MRNRAPEHHVSRPMHGSDRLLRALALPALVLLLAACIQNGASPGAGGTSTPEPQPSTGCRPLASATPEPGGCGGDPPYSAAELRLVLTDRLGPRWYCDPDEYPVSHGSEQERAIERWPEVEAERELMRAIAERLGVNVDGPVSDADKLAIYRPWKVAVSIPLEPARGNYRFDYHAQPDPNAALGLRTTGWIDANGAITIDELSLEGEPNCPICLARGTTIDTPAGPVAIERLRLGDPIWTLDTDGRRIAGTVIALGSSPAPLGHQVVRLRLADGRSVTASPGHPLVDGRQLGSLRLGDVVDGSRVVAAELVQYAGDETFDVVASGPTGAYLAGGIPLGSTLR